MPIYEYKCATCGGLTEVFQKVSDPAPATCPSCNGKETLAKVVSRTSFQLKGGGWYADLYSSTSNKVGTESGSSSSSASSTSTSTSTSTPSAPSSKSESPASS